MTVFGNLEIYKFCLIRLVDLFRYGLKVLCNNAWKGFLQREIFIVLFPPNFYFNVCIFDSPGICFYVRNKVKSLAAPSAPKRWSSLLISF